MMFRRVVGSLLARRFSPHATPRTVPARSLHLKDLSIGDGLLGAAGVAAAALFGAGALAYFKKAPIDFYDESAAPPARDEEDMKAMFEEWIVMFDKTYQDEEDKAMRFQLFKGNVKRLESLRGSRQKVSDIGYFSDWKKEERPSGRPSCCGVEPESEVVCVDERGEVFIWRPHVMQSDTPATQVSA